jgi:aspartate aminotransferase
MVKPGGAFYLFPRSPLPDDQAFVRMALDENLLLVPGSGFGTPGHFRIAYCTVSEETIRRSMEVFEKVYRRAASA